MKAPHLQYVPVNGVVGLLVLVAPKRKGGDVTYHALRATISPAADLVYLLAARRRRSGDVFVSVVR